MTKPKKKKTTKKKKLTQRQLNTLKKHSVHHTKGHMNMMKRLMRSGKSFTESHRVTMRKFGK